jgi:hypothetical protein
MPGLPANCPKCGPFVSNAIWVENSTNATFKNIGVSCPKCGGRAKGVEGTFDFSGSDISVKSAPPITHEILSKLKLLAERAKDEVPTNQELIQNIAAFSPALATALTPISKTKAPWFLLLIVWWIISNIHVNLNLEANIDLNKVVSQAIHAVEHTHSEVPPEKSKADKSKSAVDLTLATEANFKATLSREKETPSKRQLRRARGRMKFAKPGSPRPRG